MMQKMNKEEFKEAMMAAREACDESPVEEKAAPAKRGRKPKVQKDVSIRDTARKLADKADTLIMESQELIYKAERLAEAAETLEELLEGDIA